MGGKSASKRASRDAAAARADEQARQDRIRQGTQRINTIFDGGYLDGPPAASGGKDFGVLGQAMPIFGKMAEQFGAGSSGEPEATRGEYIEGAFGDAFFDGQRDRYINYAMPQVEEQKTAADKDLLFAMDRSGNTESSARADLSGELEKRAGLQRQKVRDDGMNFSTQARNNVESSRNDLIAMLNATGDAEGAANSAMARATALSQPAAYSPVGNLFADFTGALGTQAAAERAYAYGGPRPTYNTGMFAPRTGAVSVT